MAGSAPAWIRGPSGPVPSAPSIEQRANLSGVMGVEHAYGAEKFVLAANGRHHDSLPLINDNDGHEVIVAMLKVALKQ